MTSTYSPDLRLELMATGDQSGTWGDTTNTNLGTLLEQGICGVLSVAEGDTTLTLTANNGASDQARNAVVNLTGAMTAGRNVVVPTSNKLYLIKNSTTGGFAATVKTAAGTGVAVAAGTSQWVYCDGTNVVQGLVGNGVPDANNNLSLNNVIEGYAATATAAGTTTLTVASAHTQSFTGTLAQTIVMPVASTLALGQSWLLINDSVVPITVQSSGTNVIQQIPAGQRAVIICILASGTGAASWDMNVYGTGRRARRNRLINPAMQISQEHGTTSGTTNNYFPVDQWQQTFVTSAGTLTVAQVASVTPQGSPNRLRGTVTVADASLAAGEFWIITQNIEGNEVADFQYGTGSAKASVLRFGFKGPAGTYSIALQNVSLNRSFVQTFVVSAANTDVYYNIPVPSGDTTGSWSGGTNLGISLSIVLAAGSTFQGTNSAWQAGNILGTSGNTNGMGTVSSVFELFDVQFHLDVDGTGVVPGFELPGYADTLQAASRFYRKSFQYATAPAQNAGNNTGELTFRAGKAGSSIEISQLVLFNPPMRVQPAMVFYNPAVTNAQARDETVGGDCSGTSTYNLNPTGFGIACAGNASTAVGNILGAHWTASARY